MSGFGKYSVDNTVIRSNSDSLVEKSIEMLDTDGFLIAAISNMNLNVQNGTDRLKETFESTAIIDDDKTSKTNFRKEVLDQ